MTPQFQNAHLLNKISILTNEFEMQEIPINRIDFVNSIPDRYSDEIAGIYLQCDNYSNMIDFINSNLDTLWSFFSYCEITETTILCYGRK